MKKLLIFYEVPADSIESLFYARNYFRENGMLLECVCQNCVVKINKKHILSKCSKLESQIAKSPKANRAVGYLESQKPKSTSPKANRSVSYVEGQSPKSEEVNKPAHQQPCSVCTTMTG